MTAPPLRVAVLMGGTSRERGVSLRSGEAVARALAARGMKVLPVTIGSDGRWALEMAAAATLPVRAAGGTGDEPAAARLPATDPGSGPPAPGGADARAPLDAVFVALHGTFGEDGTVQGFLETVGVPYTGSRVAASALAMDKERTKEVLVHHGLRTAPWASVERDAWEDAPEAVLDAVLARVGLPAVVKHPREGSSFGVTVVDDAAALREALAAAAASADGRALVERRIRGTEVTCPVLGNRGGPLRALPLVEIVPRGRGFFDYEAKYEGASEEICPARVAPEVAARVREAALTAHRVLGCDGISRSDFIVETDGSPVYLETNTVPGMTEQSLCPLSARSAGMSFEELCETLVRLAIERRHPGGGSPLRGPASTA